MPPWVQLRGWPAPHTGAVDVVAFIPLEEAARRLALPLERVRAFVVDGAFEARETEAGLAVAADDISDPFMGRDAPRWLLEARRLQRRESRSIDTARLVRELREEREEYGV